ncbi:MAG: winged helix-turn-helix domain-containing protein [Woeseiaceae bacterium]
MDPAREQPFQLGAWLVEPELNRLNLGEQVIHLEPKSMQVLLCLCRRPGKVVSADAIIAEVWDNRPMGENPVYKSVAKLRSALSEGTDAAEYIQTVPKKGYRLIAPIGPHVAQVENADSFPPGRSRLALPIMFGVLLGIALTIAFIWERPAKLPKLTGLSTFPGSHRQPSFAPDGQRFAFVDDGESGYSQIWTLSPEATAPNQLTFGESNKRRPRWSPDGETILFNRSGGVWSVSADGGDPVRLISDAYNANWSRRGDKIVFERNYEIWIANADGGAQNRVSIGDAGELPLSPRWPAFSPDGSEIVFFNTNATPMGTLWVVGVDGSDLRQLNFASAFGGAPVWSPDGKTVIYSSERDGNQNLWKVNVNDQTEEVLLTSSGNDNFPDLSANGQRLIYSNYSELFSLVKTNPDDGSEQLLHESRLRIVGPELSPDGQSLAFFGGSRIGGIQLFRMSANGSEAVEVTDNPGAAHALPHWAGDGSSLFFFLTERGDRFAAVSSTGGEPVVIAENWSWDTANGARVDPTRSSIIYSRLSGQVPVQTFIRDITSGEDTTFYATLEYPRWSSDGSRVTGALHTDRRFPGDIAVCPVAGNACNVVAERGRIPVWSRDNRFIYFVRGFGTSQDLFVVAADGSAPERPVMTMAPLIPLGPFYQVTEDGEVIWVRYELERTQLWVADL